MGQTMERLTITYPRALLGSRFDANLLAYAEASRQHAPGVSAAVIRSRTLGEFAVSQGVVLLAQLVPEAWTLPLDVMCVPMAKVTGAA